MGRSFMGLPFCFLLSKEFLKPLGFKTRKKEIIDTVKTKGEFYD
jgi:hypothetical protein